jgi:hypothetical protein
MVGMLFSFNLDFSFAGKGIHTLPLPSDRRKGRQSHIQVLPFILSFFHDSPQARD